MFNMLNLLYLTYLLIKMEESINEYSPTSFPKDRGGAEYSYPST